jgi:hypothetical protein
VQKQHQKKSRYLLIKDLSNTLAGDLTPQTVIDAVREAETALRVDPGKVALIRFNKDLTQTDFTKWLRYIKKKNKTLDFHWESSRWYRKSEDFKYFVLEITLY